MSLKKWSPYFIPVFFSFLFFWKIGRPSFWFDEFVTIRTVLNNTTLSFLRNFVSDQLHPPLYFGLLKFYFEFLSFLNLLNQFLFLVIWANVKFLYEALHFLNVPLISYDQFYNAFTSVNILQKLESYSEVTIRLPSAIFMTAANVVVFDYFKRKNLLWIGIVSSFLIGTNTKLIFYAQEARPYALFVLAFVLVLSEFSSCYSRELKIANFGKLMSYNFVLLLTHFYGVFVVGAEMALLVAYNRKNKKFVLAVIALALGFTALFAGMYNLMNVQKFGFLRKFEPRIFLEIHQNALGYFVHWRFLVYLSAAIFVKKFLTRFEESDRILIKAALFLATLLGVVYFYSSFRPIYEDRYLLFIIPLQILLIVTIYYSISEALLGFVKSVRLKNIVFPVIFLMTNVPHLVLQPYYHFEIFDYYKSEKYYPLRSAYEAIINDRDFRAPGLYVMEEYQGGYFGFYDERYSLRQIENLFPPEPNYSKEKLLNNKLTALSPATFYLIRVLHPETSQEKESINVTGYSRKRIFSEKIIEAYKFTKLP